MQVPLSTKTSLETAQKLEEYLKTTGKTKTSVVEAALKKYMEEANPIKESKTLQIKPDWDGNSSYDLVAYSYNNEIVIYSGHKWLKEDAIASIPAFAEELVAKGYQISQSTIKKYDLDLEEATK